VEELKRKLAEAQTGIAVDLTAVAVEWSSYCLRTYKGDLLQKGMAIATALVEFHDELVPKEARDFVLVK
jgi:hypothetical protein